MNDVRELARALRERISTLSPVQRQALAFAAPAIAESHALVTGLLAGIEDLADRVTLVEQTIAEMAARETATHRRLRSLERARRPLVVRDAEHVTDAEILAGERP